MANFQMPKHSSAMHLVDYL